MWRGKPGSGSLTTSWMPKLDTCAGYDMFLAILLQNAIQTHMIHLKLNKWSGVDWVVFLVQNRLKRHWFDDMDSPCVLKFREEFVIFRSSDVLFVASTLETCVLRNRTNQLPRVYQFVSWLVQVTRSRVCEVLLNNNNIPYASSKWFLQTSWIDYCLVNGLITNTSI